MIGAASNMCEAVLGVKTLLYPKLESPWDQLVWFLTTPVDLADLHYTLWGNDLDENLQSLGNVSGLK